MSPRPRPWHMIAAFVIGVPIVYVLSIPPLVWCGVDEWIEDGTARGSIAVIYLRPVEFALDRSPSAVGQWFDWYARILGPPPRIYGGGIGGNLVPIHVGEDGLPVLLPSDTYEEYRVVRERLRLERIADGADPALFLTTEGARMLSEATLETMSARRPNRMK